VAVMAEVLGLRDVDPATLLSWYDAIVAGVSVLTEAGPSAPVPGPAAAEVADLGESLEAAIRAPGATSLLAVAAASAGLSIAEIKSNAAVMLFGGVETTEGMIVNALWHLLGDPAAVAAVTADRSLTGAAIDESLRLEPAAAVVDRYATADAALGAAAVRAGDLVTVSLAGANRDPAFFPRPDRFDLRRPGARQNLAFALGPHFCVGAQLAHLETEAAVTAVLDGLPGLRLDPARPAAPRGLVFRKPPALHVLWNGG
jgi:cytochrome P450